MKKGERLNVVIKKAIGVIVGIVKNLFGFFPIKKSVIRLVFAPQLVLENQILI
jgi:hypothetical protein